MTMMMAMMMTTKMMPMMISSEGENDAPPPQYSISQRLFGEAVLGLSQVQPVTHQALMMIMMLIIAIIIIRLSQTCYTFSSHNIIYLKPILK